MGLFDLVVFFVVLISLVVFDLLCRSLWLFVCLFVCFFFFFFFFFYGGVGGCGFVPVVVVGVVAAVVVVPLLLLMTMRMIGSN